MLTTSKDDGRIVIIAQNDREARDYELLFLSRQIPFSSEKDRSHRVFVIPAHSAWKAKEEIELFQKENRSWPYRYNPGPHKVFHIPFIHEFILLCLALFHWTVYQPEAPQAWIEKGRASALDILSGEWTRSVTALTLHADTTHLLGNLAALWIFVTGAGQYLGCGMAWLLVLLSGAMGNIMSAYFFGSNHFSIGASTSVFGAVGMMGGMRAIKGFHEKEPWKKRVLPIAASLGLLAMLGANPKSDVMAHLFGLVAGLGLGLISAPLFSGRSARKKEIQGMALGIFCGMIVLCWMVQLGKV